jgi:hypothetical protein
MPVSATSRWSAALALVALLAALLACASGGGSSTRCAATLTHKGGSSVGKGADRIQAQHEACRAWCKANDAPSATSPFLLAGCASSCGGDVMFAASSVSVTCSK